jgi:hypothetical protein
VGGDGALPRRVEVSAFTWRATDLVGLRHGDPRERDVRHRHLDAEQVTDRLAVLFRDDREHLREHPLLEVHNVLDIADPGQLDVNAGELGGVP